MAINQQQTRRLWLPLPPKGGKHGKTESAIAYAAFQKYYLMRKRSLRKVAQELGKSLQLIERWSSEFHWVERAKSWDLHQSSFAKPENWHNLHPHPATTPRKQIWLPLAPKQGKDGATETSLNHGTLLKYVAMPRGQRSLRELARQEGKSEKLMERWSSRFHWGPRAAAWDEYQARTFAADHEDRVREKAMVDGRKLNEANERLYQLSNQLFDKADKMLEFPLTDTVLETDASGRPITILKAPWWSFMIAANMAKVAFSMLGRLSKEVRQQYREYLSRAPHQARTFAAAKYEQTRTEKAIIEGRQLDEDANERAYQISEKLLASAEKMLAFPLTETRLETDASGRQITILKPAGWSRRTVCEMITLADRIRRQCIRTAREQYGFSWEDTLEFATVSAEPLC